MTAELPDAQEPNPKGFYDQQLPDVRLKPGDIVAKLYKVLDVIGVGGMSTVYRCEDLTLGRIVALKTMQAGFTADTLRRLQTEGKAIARLEHPNIVKMFGVQFIDESTPCLVMEFVPGITLANLIERQGALPVMRCLRLGSQICEGLKKAEKEGVIHRDLKPGNIMVLNAGTLNENVKILDFGIAKIHGELPLSATRTGDVVGTPQYMSPEQAQGKKCDGRSDQYSLGCVLYEMLTGKPPFTGDNALSVMIAHLQEPVPSLGKESKVPIPGHLDEAVAKLLQKDPADRFATMEEASSALFETPKTRGLPSSKSLIILATSITLFVLVAAAITFALSRHAPTESTTGASVSGALKQDDKSPHLRESSAQATNVTPKDRLLMTPHGLDQYRLGQEASFTDNERISDVGLAQIGKLTNIKVLNLRGCRLVTSAGLKRLKHLPLTFLNLDRTGVNDDAADTIADMTLLKELVLSETEVSSKTCRTIMSLPHLENLVLLYSSVDGHSLPSLARIKNLKYLNLGYDAVGGYLTELVDSSLSVLNLKGCKLTDEDFSNGLARMKNLKTLCLADTNVAGRNLNYLAKVEEIDLHNCKNLSDDDVNSFSERFPNCIISPKPVTKSPVPTGISGEELILNGDFEKGKTPPMWIDYKAGSEAITDWSIVFGSVCRMGNHVRAAHGKNCVELNGTGPGGIAQTVATVPGANYELQFYAAANHDESGLRETIQVKVPGYTKNLVFEPGVSEHDNLGWKPFKIFFNAQSKSSEIIFASTSAGKCGVFIDNVSVRPISKSARPN